MMDVSEEAELLMLRLVEGRRFVCRLELTDDGALSVLTGAVELCKVLASRKGTRHE